MKMPTEKRVMQRNAKSLRLARAAARGVTLIEVLIVVAILSLIAAGVTVAVLPKFRQAQIDTATTNAREIRNAVNRWRAMRGGDDCPTVSQLVQDKEIDSASKTTDPWDQPYMYTRADDYAKQYSASALAAHYDPNVYVEQPGQSGKIYYHKSGGSNRIEMPLSQAKREGAVR